MKQALRGGAFWSYQSQGFIRASSRIIRRPVGYDPNNEISTAGTARCGDPGFRIARRRRDWQQVERGGAFNGGWIGLATTIRPDVLVPRQFFNLGLRIAKRKL